MGWVERVRFLKEEKRKGLKLFDRSDTKQIDYLI